jgi:hypothetical protein
MLTDEDSEKRGGLERRRKAFTVLADALNRCRDEDVRSPALTAACDALAAGASESWPFEQFRRSLNYDAENAGAAAAEGRWQNVNASLNAIRQVVRV